MKFKHLLLICTLLVPMFMSAQRPAKQDNEQEETKWGPYLTNRFADNWFVGINAGAQYNAEGLLSWHLRKNFAPEVRAYFGKWFVPELGFRVGYSGWLSRNKNYSWNMFQNHLIHADVMWNWSNQFGGYKRERIYNAIPYITGGLFVGLFGVDYAAGGGLLNDFRINDNWHANIDIRAVITHGKQVGTNGGKALLGDLSIGVSYHFNKAYWDRPEKQKASSVKPEEYSALERSNQELEQINAQLAKDKVQLTKQVRDLQTDMHDLRQAVNNGERVVDTVYVEKTVEKGDGAGSSSSSRITAAKYEEKYSNGVYTPNTFYFNYAKKVLNAHESQHLKDFIEAIVEADTQGNNHYVITGYADQKTGTKSANARIALLRARYIKNQLVKAGVDAERIEVKAAKGVNLSSKAVLSRAAVIEVK